MVFPAPPITWNQRLNAWDGQTIEALRERIVRENIVRSEVANLFVDTLQWSLEHPFLPRDVETLLHCWTMLVPGSNVPWSSYTSADLSSHHFLGLIIKGNESKVLENLQRNVVDRLNNKAQTALWIAQALHVAAHLDASAVAPVLEKLTKTWLGNVKRNSEFVQEVGLQSIHMPWEKMAAIHTKFSAYPKIQEAIFQWSALCNAERLYQEGAQDGRVLGIALFSDNTDALHKDAFASNLAGQHLHWRWDPHAQGDTAGVVSYLKMLRGFAVRVADKEQGLDLTMLRQAAKWGYFRPDGSPSSFGRTVYTSVLLGDTPSFKQALQTEVQERMRNHASVSLDLLQTTLYCDIVWSKEESKWLEDGALALLLDFVLRGGNALINSQEFPSLLSFLSSETIENLRSSSNPGEQRLFWRCLEDPMSLRSSVRGDLHESRVVQDAILATTLVESYGIEHWGISPDSEHGWSHILAFWYPEKMDVWEHVWRETLRHPKNANAILLDALLQVQGLSTERWSLIQQLLDGSFKHHTDAKLALAPSRIWNIGMPIVAEQLAWVLSTMRSDEEHPLNLVLPFLEAEHLSSPPQA